MLAIAGAHVAHCPHANLKLGSGIAPVPDMRRRNVNVSLATDGAKANNRLDMFDVMKFASLIHKGVALDPTVLPSGHVLRMATLGGGEEHRDRAAMHGRAPVLDVGGDCPGPGHDVVHVPGGMVVGEHRALDVLSATRRRRGVGARTSEGTGG